MGPFGEESSASKVGPYNSNITTVSPFAASDIPIKGLSETRHARIGSRILQLTAHFLAL